MKRLLGVVVMLAFTALAMMAALVIASWKLEADSARLIYAEVARRPPHPFLQVLPGGQVGHVNAEGFRGDPVTVDKAPGTFRIFTLGGSTTLGVANPYEESYPFLLQGILRDRHPGRQIEVQNAASAWYTTAHNVVSYELRVRRFDPDLIVFYEAINDLVRSFAPPWFAHGDFQHDYSHYLGPYARLAGPDAEMGAPRSWLDGWFAWRTLTRRLQHQPSPFNQRDADNVARLAAQMTQTGTPDFRSLASFQEFYATLIRDVRADGRPIIVASQPYLYSPTLPDAGRRLLYFAPIFCAEHGTYPSMAAMIRGMDLFNGTARSVADAQHVPFVDLVSVVPKTAEYFSDDVHLRGSGNRIVATRLADTIDALGLLRR